MELIQLNDTDFVNREQIVSLSISTYYENHFIYVRMTNGNVYETDYFDTRQEALDFIDLHIKE